MELAQSKSSYNINESIIMRLLVSHKNNIYFTKLPQCLWQLTHNIFQSGLALYFNPGLIFVSNMWIETDVKINRIYRNTNMNNKWCVMDVNIGYFNPMIMISDLLGCSPPTPRKDTQTEWNKYTLPPYKNTIKKIEQNLNWSIFIILNDNMLYQVQNWNN